MLSRFRFSPEVISEALSFATMVAIFLACWVVVMPLDACAAPVKSDIACTTTTALWIVAWLATSVGAIFGFLIASILTAAANADRAEQSYRRSRVAEEA